MADALAAHVALGRCARACADDFIGSMVLDWIQSRWRFCQHESSCDPPPPPIFPKKTNKNKQTTKLKNKKKPPSLIQLFDSGSERVFVALLPLLRPLLQSSHKSCLDCGTRAPREQKARLQTI